MGVVEHTRMGRSLFEWGYGGIAHWSTAPESGNWRELLAAGKAV